MSNKKTKKTSEQEKHIFQVHTMHSDNEAKLNQPTMTSKTVAPPKGKKLPEVKKNQSVPKKQAPFVQKKNKVGQPASNPFLSQDAPKDMKKATGAKKGSFAPGKQKESVEKINQTPADIAPQKKTPKKKTEGSPKKVIHVIMIIFVILFLVGVAGFGVYMLKFNTQQKADDIIVPDDTLEIPSKIDSDVEKISNDIESNDAKSSEQLYATDLPNYFSIDVESATTKDEIATELNTIAQNMQEQDIIGPISFIVTDQNNNPVSFNVFAMSAEMNIPQDITSLLEENFEIYVYSDGTKGVRFGFVIDTKNADALQSAITASETSLPESFNIILNNLGASATEIIFNDSSYGTHPIRYYNLNKMESYSVDYTINDKRWVIGTTKDTLRAILDSIKESQVSQAENINSEY